MGKLGKEFSESPIRTISLVIGIFVGMISIAAGLSAAYGAFDDFFISPTELTAQLDKMESRMTKQYRKEALIIRNAILTDLNAQVSAITKLIVISESQGEIELYRIQLVQLNERIKEIRGQQS